MNHHPIAIACRDAAEAERIRGVLSEPSTPVFHKSGPLLTHLDAAPGCFIVMTSLILDETAAGLLTKLAIIEPLYSVVFACYADKALNLLRLYGCGCSEVLGPDELDLLNEKMQPDPSMLDEMVMPSFFIDDDESSLKEPSLNAAHPVHITFLGHQGLMSISNAMLNIEASPMMSFSCVGPQNKWAREHFEQSVRCWSRWGVQTRPSIMGGCVTICQDMSQMAALEPTSQHFVICHGMLSDEEKSYIERLDSKIRVFTAVSEGYMSQVKDIDTLYSPEKLWDILISALYGE